jgi:hypothetical protein
VHYARLVIGYHGCDASTAERILAGERFTPSENEFDWLGRGIYFWEYGLDRAWKWAQQNKKRSTPAVVGALIQLGRCFDLFDTRFTTDLTKFARQYVDGIAKSGGAIPRNGGRDRKARFLDCAIINWALDQIEHARATDGGVRPYQTVRCGFVEGGPVFRGRGRATAIRRESHVQIAVRDPECIVGVFRPSDWR